MPLTRRLFSGWPGTIAGPVSPPESIPLSESRRSSPFGFLRSGPWHLKQCSTRRGRIFASKNLAAAGETGAGFFSPASAAPTPKNSSPAAQANRIALHAIIFSAVGSTNRGRRDSFIVTADAEKVANRLSQPGSQYLLPA